MAEVILRDVSKVYAGGVKAVDRVNLSIRDGEMVVLVGPSGCGKSTTLRMVAGLEEISGGTISIGERVVNDVAPKDRDIAMVFQNYALYPHKSVYENIAFSLRLRRRALGLSREAIDRKVRDTAATLGLEPLLERKPRALSGGQRQRVALGRAIVRDPKAFLFDEPLSNLDAKLRLEMRGEIKRLHRRLSTTTIYVTHDQEEAMTLGDRIVVMKDGVVQQVAEPLEVYARPVNRFVAGFVGSPPMNFLSGRLKRVSGGVVFDEGSQCVTLPAGMAERAARHVDQPMVLGIRPEALSPAAADSTAAVPCGKCGKPLAGRFCPDCGAERTAGAADVVQACLRGRVSVVEPLGESADVFFSCGQHTGLMARIDARAGVREGQEIALYADMRRAHLFEVGEMGVNVTGGA